ncbi:hypothetical protein AK812_SmicGene28013 [Symbiodinium microadriaticum]|uniref:Uncharacterized protein n=1 Tax=Symbiodinium microadriaticum TaxID=2951 RepID=A0A1Q9D5E9_SYMMI|nr:hypothetical protein AK812_SmicGene28013 [Symbiodinium microadriaticum]
MVIFASTTVVIVVVAFAFLLEVAVTTFSIIVVTIFRVIEEQEKKKEALRIRELQQQLEELEKVKDKAAWYGRLGRAYRGGVASS